MDNKEGTSSTSVPLSQHINTDFTSDDVSPIKQNFNRPKTHFDQYIEQKAEEISQVFFFSKFSNFINFSRNQ